jgi:hypothetical protein
LPDLNLLDAAGLKALILTQHEQLLSQRSEIEHLKLLLAKLRRMQFGTQVGEAGATDRAAGAEAGRVGDGQGSTRQGVFHARAFTSCFDSLHCYQTRPSATARTSAPGSKNLCAERRSLP